MKKALYRLTVVFFLSVFMLPFVQASASDSYVFDGASFLSSEQRAALDKRFEELYDTCGIRAFVVTEKEMYGSTAENTANDYFDALAERYPDENMRLVFYLSLQPREYYLLADDSFTDYALSKMEDAVLNRLSAGEYYDAFCALAQTAERLYLREGWESEVPTGGMDSADILLMLAAVIVIPLVVAFVMTAAKLKQMNTASGQRTADNCMKPGSMNMTNTSDIFLYSNLVRTPRPKPQTGSSGSGHGGSSAHGGSFRPSSGGRIGRGGHW